MTTDGRDRAATESPASPGGRLDEELSADVQAKVQAGEVTSENLASPAPYPPLIEASPSGATSGLENPASRSAEELRGVRTDPRNSRPGGGALPHASISGSVAHEKPRPEPPGPTMEARSPETAGGAGIPGGAALGGPVASRVPSSGAASFVPGAGAPAPGLYPSVPFAEYLRWPAVSASLLKTYLGRSPLHARHEQLRGKDSAERALGRALHAAILEPAVYARTYVAKRRATGAGSREVNLHHARVIAQSGQVELSDEDRAAVEAMRAAVLAHPIAGELVRQALARELSATWTDPESGAPCKARLDLLAQHQGRVVVPDIKTCRDASWRAFQRDIQTYGYGLQAAHYLASLAALEPGPERGWLWIAVESEAPFGVAVYEPDEDLLQRGWEARARALALHRECTRMNRWPGYPETVQTITAPRWAQ